MSFLEITEQLMGGFGIALLLFGGTLLLAIPLGLFFSFLSMSKAKVVRYPTKVFIWVG